MVFLRYAVVVFVFPAFCLASGDAGFVIKLNEFSMTVRFDITQHERTPEYERFLDNPECLFYQCLWMIQCNRDVLANATSCITVLFYPQGYCFELWNESDTLATFKTNYTVDFVFDTLFGKIKSVVPGLDKQGCSENTTVFTMVYSKKHIGNQSEDSDVYFGSLPGYMYNEAGRYYYLLFWNRDDAYRFLKRTSKITCKVKRVLLTKEAMRRQFETLR